MDDSNEKKSAKQPGALFIPAGIFIGMGIGFWVDNFIAGLFVGMGAGFLAYGISLLAKK